MASESSHARILQNRYLTLIQQLPNLEGASKALFEEGVITQSEKSSILRSHDQKESLCQALTNKGIGKLVEVSKILSLKAKELKRQNSREFQDYDIITTPTVTTATSTGSFSTSSTYTSATDSQGSDVTTSEGSEGGYPQAGTGQALPLMGTEGNVYSSVADEEDRQAVSERKSLDSYQQRPVVSSEAVATGNTKHLKTDVPDPPLELLSGDITASSHGNPSRMEDAFLILFFTFITQQLQSLYPRKQNSDHDNHNSSSRNHTPSPQNHTFPWLQVDVQPDEARDFFPSEIIKSVVPNSSNPVSLKFSMLLESFQQYLRANESLKRENSALLRKGKMYDELVRKNRALEAKMTQMQASLDMQGGVATGRGQGSAVAAAEKTVAELKEELKQLEPLQVAYIRSEERCKQLVEVTQQWAIECDEKVRFIHALEKETSDLKTHLQQLDARVSRYKKFWMENKDLPRGRVSDYQFDELRSELAFRRELYDQVLTQRDEAEKKMKTLVSELESLKDHNVQLQDRADNFKILAQAKEPSVREMSHLLEQKGALEHEVDRLKRENAEFSDKIMALELLVKDLTAKVAELQDEIPAKKKDQDDWMMVSPTHRSQFSLNPPPPAPSALPPPAYTRPPHYNSQHLAPPTSSTHQSGRTSRTPSTTSSRDDVLSLASSEGGGAESGSFSSYGSSTSEVSRPSGLAHSNSSSSPPSPLKSRDVPLGSHDLPLRSHDVALKSHDMPLRARNVPVTSHEAPLRARGPPAVPRPLPPAESHDRVLTTPPVEDYTRQIRYPNNSRILVPPLKDEDISLRSEGVLRARDPPIVQGAGEKKVAKEAVFCDRSRFDFCERQFELRNQARPPNPPAPNQPTAYLPADSALLSSGPAHSPGPGRKCPMCQHTFYALSEREFETHAAVCHGNH